MPLPIVWTDAMDEHLVRSREAGECWHQIAQDLRVGRNACIERARSLGVKKRDYLAVPPAEPAFAECEGRDDRVPLRPGSAVSWAAITAGTCLEGAAYG